MYLLKIKVQEKSKRYNQASGVLSDEEISKMVKEAEANKEAIRKKEKRLIQEIKLILFFTQLKRILKNMDPKFLMLIKKQ